MSVAIDFEDLAAYVDYRKLVADNAFAEFEEAMQALVDVGSTMLNGEPDITGAIESGRVKRLVKAALDFKRLNATKQTA